MLCYSKKQLLALCDKVNKKTASDAVLFTYFYVVGLTFRINGA
ncbi:hypothetical protein B194_3152 [Serratia plymuthica A30]|nr:hypothetical protein B194_3152 [Serratia plymuthica A30]